MYVRVLVCTKDFQYPCECNDPRICRVRKHDYVERVLKNINYKFGTFFRRIDNGWFMTEKCMYIGIARQIRELLQTYMPGCKVMFALCFDDEVTVDYYVKNVKAVLPGVESLARKLHDLIVSNYEKIANVIGYENTYMLMTFLRNFFK